MTGRLIVTYISGSLYNLGNVYISRLTQTWGQLLSNVIRLHYNYFAIFMITLHYDYINFQM
jgi:hypothetical protein